MNRLSYIAIVSTAFYLLFGGCAPYPNRLESKTVSRAQLTTVIEHPPQYQWAYAGSDDAFQYFMRWNYGDVLLPLPRRSIITAYKVPKMQLQVTHEMPLTSYVEGWRPCFRRRIGHEEIFTIDKVP